MRKFSLRVGAVLALSVLLLSASSPLALAATSNTDGSFNVVVSPIASDLEVNPGGTVTATLQVKNQGVATEHIKTTILKFNAHGDDGTPKLLNVDPSDESIKWASTTPDRFDAEPNVWKSVQVSISPPKGAAFGYYYAIVFSRDGAEQQIQKSKANLLGAVASLILLDVRAPGAVRQAQITEFSTAGKVQEFLPVTFTVRMHNSGNVHVAPRGNIFITKGGKSVALLEVNLAKSNILPKTNRKFITQWTDGTPSYKVNVADGKTVLDAQGKPTTSLDWSDFNMSKLRFGKYDAKLVMVYDDGHGDVATEARLTFWVIPWRIIAVAVVAILLIGAGVWALIIRPLSRRLKQKSAK